MALKAGTKSLSNNKSLVSGDVPLKVLKIDWLIVLLTV